jgi:hypothetical protein
MTGEVDINKIITGVLSKQIDGILSGMRDAFGKKVDQAYAKFNMGYADYIKRSYAKCAQIKTILYRHQPVLLKEHYVQPTLQSGNKKVDGSGFAKTIKPGTKSVVIGTAGSGKSLFMKYTYMQIVDEGKPFVPLFLELRLFDSVEHKTLKTFVFSQVNHIVTGLTEEFFELSLHNGAFVLFLDGFDEIDHKISGRVEKEILALSTTYSRNVFVISTRPDERFMSWQEFSVFNIQPMSKLQVVELISKINYEASVKEKFVQRLVGGLYETHKSFLSIPLLATIMLLTFEQIADIPAKSHVFYQQAFETLFQRHDAVKEMYSRQRFTSFSVDIFKRIFSAFCLVSYLKQKFSFTEAEAVQFLEEALVIDGMSQAECDPKLFLKDLIHSVCLLQKDGSELQFSHRSFQEYFCASYICSCDVKIVSKLLDQIVIRVHFDRVLEMIRDMNPEVVDRYWAIPRLQQIIARIKDIDIELNPKQYALVFSSTFKVHSAPRIAMFMNKGRLGINKYLIRHIYDVNELTIDHIGEYTARMALVQQYKQHDLDKDFDLKVADMSDGLIAGLLASERVKEERAFLIELHDRLKSRYAKKDERIKLLLSAN